MALTYTKANAMLQYFKTNTIYVGLGLDETQVSGAVAPDRSGNFSEVPSTSSGSSTGYERKSIIAADWTANTSAGTISNTNAINFNEVLIAWGKCKYALLFSGSTGNNLIGYTTLSTVLDPQVAQIPVIRAGDLTVAM